jgi:hypothetical protein
LRYTLFLAIRLIWEFHAGTAYTGRTTPAISNKTTAVANVAVIANSRLCRIALVRVARWHAEAVAGEGLAQRWPGDTSSAAAALTLPSCSASA